LSARASRHVCGGGTLSSQVRQSVEVQWNSRQFRANSVCFDHALLLDYKGLLRWAVPLFSVDSWRLAIIAIRCVNRRLHAVGFEWARPHRREVNSAGFGPDAFPR